MQTTGQQHSGRQTGSEPRAPSSVQELDLLIRRIDLGEESFAALSDEQRTQLKCELGQQWVEQYLDDYPVPSDVNEAAREYRAIASGDKFPHLPSSVRNDLLIQFDQLHAEGGGPEHWTGRA
jgi:hypothetical protein